jgi:hypothetical protein
LLCELKTELTHNATSKPKTTKGWEDVATNWSTMKVTWCLRI